MSDEIVGHKTFSDGKGGFRHEPLTRGEADAIMEAVDKATAKRAADMPTEQDAVRALWDAHQRLKELGWQDPRYAEREKEMLIVELGSSGIHRGSKQDAGECWWIPQEGDLWPSHPCLCKPLPQTSPQPQRTSEG